MHRFLFLLSQACIVLFLGACTNLAPQYTLNDLDTIHTQTQPSTSSLISYDITGAVWLADQPLLINKEFNFGAAMSIEGAGVAIAVGMRNNKNEALATELKSMPALNLNARLQGLLTQNDIALAGNTISVFGVLYGQPKAHLRTVIEVYSNGNDDKPQRFMDYSPWLAATGDESWSENDGDAVWQYFNDSLPRIVTRLKQHESDVRIQDNSTKKEKEIKYVLKGGDSIQKGRGYVLGKDNDRIVIQSTTIPNTIISMLTELVEVQDIPEEPTEMFGDGLL